MRRTLPPAEQNAANLALARERLVEGIGVCRMMSWPEHVAGPRAQRGQRQRDYAIACWEGREFLVLRGSATTWLARALVAAGCPDQPWEMFTLAGTRSLHGGSLHPVGEAGGDRGRAGAAPAPIRGTPECRWRGRLQDGAWRLGW